MCDEPNPFAVEQQAALAEAQREKEEEDRAAQAAEEARSNHRKESALSASFIGERERGGVCGP